MKYFHPRYNLRTFSTKDISPRPLNINPATFKTPRKLWRNIKLQELSRTPLNRVEPSSFEAQRIHPPDGTYSFLLLLVFFIPYSFLFVFNSFAVISPFLFLIPNIFIFCLLYKSSNNHIRDKFCPWYPGAQGCTLLFWRCFPRGTCPPAEPPPPPLRRSWSEDCLALTEHHERSYLSALGEATC